MRLVQFLDAGLGRSVACVSEDGRALQVIGGVHSVYNLALEAVRQGTSLAALAAEWRTAEQISYERVASERRLLPPLDHSDAARWLVTGTGLSHLGSAAARDSMHAKIQQDESQLTDS